MLRIRLPSRVLGAAAGAAASLWIFVELAAAVGAGGTREADALILMALRMPADVLGPAWQQEFVRDLSGLGGPGVLSLLVAVTVGFLLLSGRWWVAIFVLAQTLGGAILVSLLKQGFGRDRPDLVFHETWLYGDSFPSAHAMLSTLVYLTLGVLLARELTQRWQRCYVMAVAVLLIGLIGVSRIGLGVHWPSDVLAGWILGAAWVLACWVMVELGRLGSEALR